MGIKSTNFFVLILLFASLFPVVLYAQAAQSVVITRPTTYAQNEAYGMRINPVTGAYAPHRGVDYSVPCGTTFTERGGNLTCGSSLTYGGLGMVSWGCGVQERYAHLQSCNAGAGTMLSGGARGMVGAGRSTGCHLHYEIIINGVTVDPVVAFGQNLCDPAVQSALIADAQAKNNGMAAGGSGGGGGAAPGPVMGPMPPTTDILVPEVDQTDNPVTGCDTQVWRAMVNLAVLQTRREMVVNETLIAKPDSVLGYSCFVNMFQTAANNLGVFSETQRWRNRQINLSPGTTTVNVELGQTSLDGALTNTTLSAYETYMEEYFAHDFLGGTAPSNGSLGGPQDYPACGIMARVWQAAKCKNVEDNAFPSFQSLVAADPRVYPAGYECTDTGITDTMITTAAHAEVDISPYTTGLDLLDVNNNNGNCFPPIRTGVTVIRREGPDQITNEISYEDGLCITAGCSYQRAADPTQPGTCVVITP